MHPNMAKLPLNTSPIFGFDSNVYKIRGIVITDKQIKIAKEIANQN